MTSRTKAKLLREVTLTAADLGSFLNFTQLGRMTKFKIEPKCAAVKVTSLSEVALVATADPIRTLKVFLGLLFQN